MRSLLVFMMLFAACAAYAAAQATPAATQKISTGTLDENLAGNDTAQGGNVTLLNLSVQQSTSRWQGYYGNISGSLSLGVGSNIFFDFSAATVSSVFASQNASFDFTSLAAGSAAAMDAAWGYSTGQDRAQDIYSGTTSIEGVNAPSVELEPAGNGWNSTLCNNGAGAAKGSYAFGVNVQEPAVSCFDGSDCDPKAKTRRNRREPFFQEGRRALFFLVQIHEHDPR